MDWHQAFPERILNRGLDYYHRELVGHLDKSDDFVEAAVYGSDLYHVKIKLIDGEIVNMKCDCPFAFDGNHCKHMAAVLFRAEDMGSTKKEKTEKTEESLSKLV